LSEEKTEQPTEKRLRDSREKGQVAKSQEVPAAAVVLVLAVYLLLRGPAIAAQLNEAANAVMDLAFRPFDEAAGLAIAVAGNLFLKILGPLVPMVVMASLLASLGQIGLLFSLEAAKPKLENLSPGKWFKKTFSKNNLFDLLKNVIKVVVLGATVWHVMAGSWKELSLLPRSDAQSLSAFLGTLATRMILWAAAAFAALAAIDFLWQRYKHTKDNMMSKDEVKREYKEMEGDPVIKSRRRQLHQELASQGALDSVRRSKVVVANPTHYAVALDYEEGRTPMPIVTAKGEGELARRMIEAAERAGVPVMREAALARDLYENSTENAFIPKSLIGPVAEVLRWLRSLEAGGR
jgi:type III secretion protein U